ncbi:protein FAM228A [Centropristis striata]|uniref:protein FAM228A n=1 Tax=Centropristis striata TaxID=184440 RepID=UPI0027E10647|nr:protein FAM228A [Centropristis striata]
MSHKKRNTASGVITFHTPFSASMFKSEECRSDVKDTTESRKNSSQPSAKTRSPRECVRAEKREEASPCGPQSPAKQDWLSHTSVRQLQAKMEAENHQVQEIIQPLLDTQNGFMKELDRFLRERDVCELRRKELLHKRWTERVWFPLQRKVEEHVSSCSPVAVKRRQNLYSAYLQHCTTKGFVFLDHYDPREYNPFSLPSNFKLSKADLKDPLYCQLHEREKARGTARSCEAGYKYTRRKEEKIPQVSRPLSETVTSQANKLLQASSLHWASASRNTSDDKSEGSKSSRLDTTSYHISATATPFGRCHQTGCWLPRCGRWQQPASLQQLQSSFTSK